MNLASLAPQAALPSPSTAVWQLGPVPIRAYALCIVLGIVVAAVVTEARLRRRGVAPGATLDIAVWAVPFGIIGARLYHVISSPQAYFGADGHPLNAFKIWEGGLGIWGAIVGGALGAWLAVRQLGLPLSVVADALAPGLPLAQAIGRLGNWFNNELYGGPTTLPWGLQIHRMDPDNPGHALRDGAGNPVLEPALYHPTFLYELVWNLGVAALVYLVDRRVKFGRGRAFALYVMAYTAGRFWIEMMRRDEANIILGLRLNVWTSVLVFLGALIYFLRVRGPREYVVPVTPPAPAEPAGDISRTDVSRPTAAAAPTGYRVVSEAEFRTYQETGELPAGPAGGDGADPAPAADAAPVSAESGEDEPDEADEDEAADGPDRADRARAAAPAPRSADRDS
ncbi:prolipoprotein diacylglyceryl transferase [Micromonospora zhanjiangensis]|uniref:Phosphatidylglycerol--prolipoprotein diacylglyceryl transferase n=1 Tax=Micromonospora zhanjiangensis TaxID=1522057 RepID=A0ABV8KQD7_9ACTN